MIDAELAVLSLVVECPRHAYEIERVIAERGMRDWTDVGFSSIYYLLGKMERAGLVKGHRDETTSKGPARRVYSPTAEGFLAWTEASLQALSTPQAKMPFLLGLTNLGGLPPDRALEAVRACHRALNERLSVVRVNRRAAREVEWFVGEVFDYGEQSLRSGRDWVAGLVERLEQRGGQAMPTKMKPFVPQLREMPAATMAVVHTVGDPTEVAPNVFPALYGAGYGLKFALKKAGRPEFKVTAPRARGFIRPGGELKPRDQWKAAWALEVPDGTTEVPQKDPETPVVIERWEYGTVAEVLHVGTYAEEGRTIELLHEFIAEQGYEIVGDHEEEYRSRPDAKSPKTVIRYRVRKRDG